MLQDRRGETTHGDGNTLRMYADKHATTTNQHTLYAPRIEYNTPRVHKGIGGGGLMHAHDAQQQLTNNSTGAQPRYDRSVYAQVSFSTGQGSGSQGRQHPWHR